MDSEAQDQLFAIEATVNRLTATCFKVCDDGKGRVFSNLQCLEFCISEWMQAKNYVHERWDTDVKSASLYNKNLAFVSKHV